MTEETKENNMQDKNVWTYAVCAKDRKTGQWCNQDGENAPRCVGNWNFMEWRGLPAVLKHNPEMFGEIIVKRFTLHVDGGEIRCGIPTLGLKQEVWHHLVLMPIAKPRPNTHWVTKSVEGKQRHWEMVWLTCEGIEALDKEKKIEFLRNKE